MSVLAPLFFPQTASGARAARQPLKARIHSAAPQWIIQLTNNLFVTSKNEFTNSRI